MVKRNYSFDKRQRDLAKKKKKEEKRLRKAGAKNEVAQPDLPVSTGDENTVD